MWAPRLAFLRDDPVYFLAFVAFAATGGLVTVQRLTFLAVRLPVAIVAQAMTVQGGRIALVWPMAYLSNFGAIAASGLAGVVGAVLGLLLLTRWTPGLRVSVAIRPSVVGGLLPFSVGAWLADGLLVTPALAMPLLVVGLLGAREAGQFYVPWSMGYLLTSASLHLGLSLFAEGSHKPRMLASLSRRAMLAALAVAALGSCLFLGLGPHILRPFGAEYAHHGTALLRAMGLAAVPAAAVNVCLGRWKVRGRMGALTALAAFLAIAELAAGALFLPLLGLVGAGAAHGAAQALGLGLAILLEARLTGARRALPSEIAAARQPGAHG